jgi:transposase
VEEDVGMAKESSSKYSRRYSPEFKRDAVALVGSSGRPVVQVAKELGVSDVTLACWVRELGKDAATLEREKADRQEEVRLRKRVKELEDEIEILKRFTAYWVTETSK